MRFILVKCTVFDERFPDHVQWRATASDETEAFGTWDGAPGAPHRDHETITDRRTIDIFFWLRREDGEIGAKEYIRKRWPNAAFSDEKAR